MFSVVLIWRFLVVNEVVQVRRMILDDDGKEIGYGKGVVRDETSMSGFLISNYHLIFKVLSWLPASISDFYSEVALVFACPNFALTLY